MSEITAAPTVGQQRLVRLREAIKELELAACDAREHLLSLEHRWMMDRAKPILQETDYHAMLALDETNAQPSGR